MKSWKGPEVDYRAEGLHVFSAAEIEEVDHALRHLAALGDLDLPEITPETFPLDSVARLMRGLRARLRDGHGFMMLRGLPRERYTADEMAQIYVGLGSHLGTLNVQSYLGDLLGHVIDVSDVEPKSRGYRKGGGQEMHVEFD